MLSDETGRYVARTELMEEEAAWNKWRMGRTIDCDTEEKVCVCVCVCVEMPVVVYGRETWSVTLMEELMLRTFGNKALRKIFGRQS
jgi:hypothetical protein